MTLSILCGAAVAAAALAVSSDTASAMPLDDRIPGALDDWIEKTQVWVAMLVEQRSPGLRLALGVI